MPFLFLFFRMPHRGAGRIIAPGQRVHISVAFKGPNKYHPRAEFLRSSGIKWESFVGGMLESKDFKWALDFGEQVELDLFDASFTTQALNKLKHIWGTAGNTGGTPETLKADESYWMKRLAFMAPSGRLAEQYVLELGSVLSEHSLEQIRSGVALFQKLEDSHPGTFDRDVASLLEQEGHLLFGLKQLDKALPIYRKAEMFWQNRTTKNTKHKAHLKDYEKLASCLRYISWCCHNLKQHQDELEADRSIVNLYRNLLDNVKDPIITKDLAQALHNLGVDLSNLGHHKDALETDKEAADLYRTVVETDPSVPKYLAQTLHNLGVDFSNLGQYEEALRTNGEAVKLRRKLVETDPTVTKDLAWSLYYLGIILRRLGRHKEALGADEEATQIRRNITDMDPSVLKYLAGSLENVGLNLNAIGRYEDAVQAGEEAAKIFRELPDPTVEVELELANTQKLLAVHLRAVNRLEEASHNDKEGDEMLHKLGETEPGATAHSFHVLAVDLRTIRLQEDALQAEESAIALYRKLPEMQPHLFGGFIDTLESLAKNLHAVGREDDAMRVEAEVANLKSSPMEGPSPLVHERESSR
jgi:tetratricopeptide (TPR) repeat protein